MGSRGRLTVTAVIAAGAIVAAACSPGDDDPDRPPGASLASAPPGFSVERAERVSLAIPDDWTRAAGPPGAVLVVQPPDAAGAYPALVAVYVEDGFEGTLEEYRFTFNAESNTALPGREVVEETPATVPGADGALLVEAEYPAPDDADVIIRQIDLIAVTADGTTSVDVRASAPAQEFDALRSTFEQILESVVLGAGATGA